MGRGLFGALASGLETKTTDISSLTWEKLFGEEAKVKAGVSVNIDSSLAVPTVLAVTRALANGVAQIPLKVFREKDDGSKVLAKDHPAYKLLWRRPNDWMTSFEFRQLMMFHAVLNGNAYAYIGRGGVKRRLVELIPLVGHVTAKQAADWTLSYEVTGRDGVTSTYRREDILHLRGPSWNGFAGMNAIKLAREAIGLAIATEETQSRMHGNGAKPGGLLSFEKELGDKAKDRLKALATENISGLRSAFKTLVLDNGAKWTPFQMTGVDGQHLETRKFQIEEICRDLGVFPQMVGHSDKTATFASAEAFFLAHVIHSLAPWIENWQQVFARDLFPDEDDISAEFSVQGLLRGDHKTRAEFYASGIINGYFTRNEVRGWENLNPIDGLDEPLIPLNMGTASERAAMAKEVTAAVKSMMGHNGGPVLDDAEIEMKVGRVLSTANERRIKSARDELETVLNTLPKETSDDAA
ncbi:phage portal protein [Mesorhizobium sp. M0130]|uniref:phage portal protein n=1 Tax=Mesorhizobium sp. M0130 TaxID=2956887 RepID=UPI0033382743